LAGIKEALANGKPVHLQGFGSFYTRTHKGGRQRINFLLLFRGHFSVLSYTQIGVYEKVVGKRTTQEYPHLLNQAR
jgi:hypothetical protein